MSTLLGKLSILVACAFLRVGAVRPHIEVSNSEPCGGVYGAKLSFQTWRFTNSKCHCDSSLELAGSGCGKADGSKFFDPPDILNPAECACVSSTFKKSCALNDGHVDPGVVLRCVCTDKASVFQGMDCGTLANRRYISSYDDKKFNVLSNFSDCSCRPQSSTVKLYSTFAHIKNDAMNFCAGLFTFAQQGLTDSERLSVDAGTETVDQDVISALTSQHARKICQTALTEQVTTEVADKELLGLKQGVAEPEPGNNTRAFRVLDGSSQTQHSWQPLLKRVCADECRDLVNRMIRERSQIERAAVKVDGVIELCARKVVQKTEAEVLTCCGQECGWDDQTCRLWPFFDASEKQDWNARCCTEGTILQNSSRERLCNSVQPEVKRQELSKVDPKQGTSQDALTVGQDLNPQPGLASLVESGQSGPEDGTQCDMEFGTKCGTKQARKTFLEACKNRKEENWEFLTKADHDVLGGLEGVGKLEKTNIRECYRNLQHADAVSWYDNMCYFVEKRSDDITYIYTLVEKEVTPVIVNGAALFKRK